MPIMSFIRFSSEGAQVTVTVTVNNSKRGNRIQRTTEGNRGQGRTEGNKRQRVGNTM